MSERRSERDKKGRSVLARCVVICIVAAFIGSLGIAVPGLAAQQTGDTVKVTVNAPEFVEETFTATIDVDSIANFNSAQFDLSFDSSVVDVTDVREGEIGGKVVPIFMWSFVDADTVRVLVSMPLSKGVSGSGSLAEVEFEVKGKSGDKSKLDISGLLVDTEAREIEADWYDDEVTVLRTVVSVDAPEYVSYSFNAVIKIDDVTDLNSAQFDLSFDSSVVDVTDVKEGEIDGETVPIFMWNLVDADTVRVLVSMPMGVGVSGSGSLADVEFEVIGKSGDKSKLDISSGMLVDTEAKEIEAEWYDDEVTIPLTPVTVDAPEYVSDTFNAIIRIDDVTDLNSAQFDLSFDSRVVDVTDVKEGEIDGKAVPIFMWSFIDADTIRVLVSMPMGVGLSGSGSLAEVEFEVKGKSGDKSKLDISKGMLVDTEAEEIKAEWYDDEVIVKIEKPSVIIETDKSVYKSGEEQIITITVENPTSEPVQAKLGMGFHVYEIGGSPYSYDRDIFETELIWLPAGFEKSFVLSVEGLELPEGEYAWSAYLKDAVGMKIAESEAKFSIAAVESSISTVPSPNDAIFEDLSENVKQAVNAELL